MTGLIYVGIIALWAAVLIPMWLRRHDQISEVRSTARFSSAMRSLGAQGQPQFAMEPGLAQDMMYPPRSGSPVRAREASAMRSQSSAHPGGIDPSYGRKLASQAAARRRATVLGTLSLVLMLGLVLAFLGIAPRWLPILAAIPVAAFVVATAMTAPQRSSAHSTRASRSTPRTVDSRAAEAVAREVPAARASATVAVEDDWETWNAWDDDDSWDAVPTTLPTYVNAPRASAVPRNIDRSRPGEWTGEAMMETAQSMRMRERSQPLDRPQAGYGEQTAEIPVVNDDYARRVVNE